MNTVNTNIFLFLNREKNHLDIHNSYLEIEFVVLDNAGGVFANNANIILKLILVILKERHFIRMYSMLLTSYLILVWKKVWKDPNTK